MTDGWQSAPVVNEWESAPPVEDESIPTIPGTPIERTKIPAKSIEIEGRAMGRRTFNMPEYTEPETAYQKRQAEHFGFKEPAEQYKERYTNLPSALATTMGEPEDMKRVVDLFFGDDAKLKFHEGFQDYVVEFKDGTIAPFNQPGLGMEDVKSLRGEGMVMSGEIAGGFAGATVGSMSGPIGTVAGGGLGAAGGAGVGKYKLLKIGQESGANEMSDGEILGAAAVEAAWALGGEIVFGGGGLIVRRFLANPAAKSIAGEVTEEQVEEAIKYAENISSRVKERTGVEMDATVGQITTQVDAEAGRKIQTFERALEAHDVGVGAEARATQKEAEAALKKEMFGEVPKDLEEAVPFGEAVQEIAQGEVMRRREAIVMSATEERAEAVAKQLEITAPPADAENAAIMRKWMSDARDSVFEQLGERYQRFWANVPDVKVELSGIRGVAAKWNRILKDDIFPSLTEEDNRIVRDAMEAGLKREKVPAFDEEGLLISKEILSDVGGTFDQVSRAISTMKAEMRFLKTAPGAAKAREAKMLNEFIDELEAARDAALEGIDPALRDQLDALDTAYRVAKEEIDLSLINRIITRKKGGGYRVADDKLFDSILRSGPEARNLARVIANPDYKAFNTAEAIKEGIMDRYRDRVIDGTMTHQSFVAQKGLREIFSPKEMRRFDSLAKAKATIKLADAREATLMKELDKTFPGRVGEYDPEDIMEMAVGRVSETRRLKEMLKLHPEKWEQYKALRARRFLNKIESVDDVGEKFADFEKMDAILGEEKGELAEVFGRGFINDLELLRDISRLRRVPKSQHSAIMQGIKEVEATPQLLMWRAIVARPLSRMGLVTTSALKLNRRSVRSATAKLLSDPELLRRAMSLYRKKSRWEVWKTFLNTLGAAELARQVEDQIE